MGEQLEKEILGEVSKTIVTVVTVNLNNYTGLKKTVDSVLSQKDCNFQYLIVDGGSVDESCDFLNDYCSDKCHVIIAEDQGIYHAMNKGLAAADGEWLLFMNSGDVFLHHLSLSTAISTAEPDTDVIYADWIYNNSRERVKASKNRMVLRHQSVVYKKALHNVHGTYVSSPGITISDYIFFLSIANANWVYSNTPLSICDESGVSSKVAHFYQKVAVDFLYQRCGRVKLVIILSFYPAYKFLKNFSQRLLKFMEKKR